jgi:hypothetical protein
MGLADGVVLVAGFDIASDAIATTAGRAQWRWFGKDDAFIGGMGKEMIGGAQSVIHTDVELVIEYVWLGLSTKLFCCAPLTFGKGSRFTTA